jgi:hypothetical protein
LKPSEVAAALATTCPTDLAETLIREFMAVRQDVATRTLGRAAPGKLVETFVQLLQHLDSGSYEPKPDVDEYLRKLETRPTTLDDGLRICGARVARAMYTMRNKRTIAHIGRVDPNVYDLRLLLHASQWLIAELVRVASKVSMTDAGRLMEQVHEPVGGLIEDYDGKRLVLADLSTREELIVLLHGSYPDFVPLGELLKSLNRRPVRTVKNTLRTLWNKKFVDGDGKAYRLTSLGFEAAVEIIRDTMSPA